MSPAVPYIFGMITVIVAVAIYSGISLERAKVRQISEEDFELLRNSQDQIVEGIAELRTRAAAIETLLREVE
jgi:hypothetical protein